MESVSYRCPNCDAGLEFNAEKQKITCEFCLSEFTKAELDQTDSAQRAEEKAKADAEFSEQMNEYQCPSCGAEVVADEHTAASYCYYCHNPIVPTGKVSGMMRPHKIIPFKFDKDGAKQRFFDLAKKKRFLPSDFLDEKNLDMISGIYYPFWVTDADARGNYHTRAHKVRTWQSGGYRYTETSDFAVDRSGNIHFEDIVSSALSTEDKKMLEGILPYPSDAHIDFDMPYLLGYTAKKRNIEREALSDEVRKRMQNYTQTLLRGTVNGYSSTDIGKTDMNLIRSTWSYTLLPLYILTYRRKSDKKGRVYTYAMNGYTGKLYGAYPVSAKRLLLHALGMFVVFGLLGFLIGGLFL
ncbi:MAG: TFIIB-type zinc ribbon-containing protein [Clostridia bacterium]|nr:TFIIB-type zinc ribbon-containing protein [Clostridia bacterium]